MWNRREKPNGRVRVRASRLRGGLILQVECDLYELVPEGDHLVEHLVGARWRDATVADLNDIGYLTSSREHVTRLGLTTETREAGKVKSTILRELTEKTEGL